MLRSTKTYADIITLSNHPRFSVSPLLKAAFLCSALYNDNYTEEIIRKEYLAILDGKVPYFTSDIKNRCLYSYDGEVLPWYDKFPVFKDLKSNLYRIKKLDEETNWQKKLLSFSLETLLPSPRKFEKKWVTLKEMADFIEDRPFLYKKKYRKMQLHKNVDGLRSLKEVECDIYDGLGGALFLRICDWIIAPSESKEKNMINFYNEISKDYKCEKKIGIIEPRGNILYLDYLIFKYTGLEQSYFNFQNRLYDTLIKISESANPSMDLFRGVAGILVICCRLYAIKPENNVLKKIKLLTTIICRRAIHVDDKKIAWGKKWTGFSHGNSGIAYALMLADNFLDAEELKEYIISALRYEEGFKIASGWKGVEIHDNDKDYNSWCNGGVGIYMVRKAMLTEMIHLTYEIKEILIKDIKHYEDSFPVRGLNPNLSLCHGAYGNAIIDPANYPDKFDVDIDLDDITEDKSLMTGKAGAVYVNAFLNNKDKPLPNILLLK